MNAVRSFFAAVLLLVVLAMRRLRWPTAVCGYTGRLPNPDNDARDMAALRRLGFEVTTELDADRVKLTEVLRALTRQSVGADVSLVFYAGHGIEMGGSTTSSG